MTWFRNIRIAAKLGLAFAVMIALMALVGRSAVVRLADLERSAAQLGHEQLPRAQRLTETRLAMSQLRWAQLQEVVAADRDGWQQKSASINGVQQQLSQLVARGDEEQRALAAYNAAWEHYLVGDAAFEQQLRVGKRDQALATLVGQQASFDRVNAAGVALPKLQSQAAADQVQAAGSVYASDRTFVGATLGLALVVAGLLAWAVSRSITRPLEQLAKMARDVAGGRVDQPIAYQGRDEVGLLADAMRGVTSYIGDAAQAMERLGAGDLTVELTARSERDLLSKSFQDAVHSLKSALSRMSGTSVSLLGAAEQFGGVSRQMGSNAEETSNQANVVAAAADQVSKNVHTVASSAEEMSASVKEVAKNAAEAARVASTAVKVAEHTNVIVTKLGTSSAEIGKVIKVITSIAEQTNLLALNATIEAARAGEAGKGFAVVANEVKELAKETAKATEDIGRKVAAIQGDAKDAADAIRQIGQTIGQVNDIQNTIAGAVEEQAATTNDIGRNVSEAARATADIAENIAGVAQAAQSTSSGARQCQDAASELATMSTEIQALLTQFRTSDGPSMGKVAAGAGIEPANENGRAKRPKLVAA